MDQTDVLVVAGEAPASSSSCDRTELPADLLVPTFGAMQIKDLCSPCLVYSAADRDDGTATLHHLYTDKLHHLTLPDPAFRSRYVMGSSRGWIITADDRSKLILVNPVTGAQTQIAMPPPGTMSNVELRYGEEDGKPDGYNLLYADTVPHNFDPEPKLYGLSLEQGRFPFYTRVAPVVRSVHWELHRGCGDVHTIDLHGPSALVNIVYKHKGDYTTDSKYIVQAPWGDFFQIWRWDRYLEEEEEDDDEYDDNGNDSDVNEIVEGIMVATEIEAEEDEEETESVVEEHEEVEVANKDCGAETETKEEEVYNVLMPAEEKERVTANFRVYKIDFVEQKLARVNNLQDHTLFTGFNTSFFLPAKDCSTLIPNSIYHADDLNLNTFSKRFSDRRVLNDQGLRQVFIFNMEDGSFTDILPPTSSRLNWPPPVWIQPSLS
ncbi:hypothetical protein ACQ4PT_050187 [Festuca glaucescens]